MNNVQNATIEQNGGVTRLTIASVPPAHPELGAVPYMANRVGEGALRFDMGTGGVTQGGVTKHTVGQDRSTTSVAATLQRVNGADTVELIPGVSGSRTHIRQALADGLIEAVGPGLWRDKGVTTQEAPRQSISPVAAPPGNPEDEPPRDMGAGVFSPEEDEHWATAIEPISQSGYDAAAASVMVAILSGAPNLDTAAKNLAQQEGMPLELASEYVTKGQAMYSRLVQREAASVGVENSSEFFTWLRQERGRGLQEAIQSLTIRRDITKFRNLALEFKNKAPGNSKR